MDGDESSKSYGASRRLTLDALRKGEQPAAREKLPAQVKAFDSEMN